MKKHLLKLLLLCCIGILALSLFACVPSTDQYKVDFIVDGEVYNSRTTSGNSRVVPPSDPVKSQYIFRGWYFDEGEWTDEFHPYSFEKNPIKEDVKIYAWFELDEAHTCDKQWKTELEATCVAEGRKVLKCAYRECGKVYSTEVIPLSTKHSTTTDTVKADVVDATCTKQGSYIEVKYCSLCKAKISETKKTIAIDKNAHNFGNGELKKVGNKFTFDATCSNLNSEDEFCGLSVSLSDVDVTVKVVKNVTCDEDGTIKYVYSAFGCEFSTEEETVPATGHILCGVAIEDKVYNEEDFGYLYSKITMIAADDKNCGEEISGIFKCDVCSEISTIRVGKPHLGSWTMTAEPECYKDGKEQLASCSACGGTNLTRKVPATGEHKDGETILVKEADNLFHLAKACVNRSLGCVHYDILIEDVEVTKKEVISTSCKVDDVIRYSYKSSGKTYTYDETIASGHFLNGVRADTLMSVEGWFDYHLVGDGITLFNNIPLTCDKSTEGYYICDSCKGDVLVDVYRPHSGSWVTTLAPTCVDKGVSNFYCDLCDYGHAFAVTKELDEIPHDYVLELKPRDVNNPNLASFYLSGECSHCKKGFVRDYITASVSVSKAPTCVSYGELEYKCIYGGEVYKYTETIPMLSHTINGKTFAKGDRFEYAEYVLTGKIPLSAGVKLECVGDKNDQSHDVDAKAVCDGCKQSFDVKVYRLHDGEWQTFKDMPTSPCIVTGKKQFYCSYSLCTYTATEPIYEENHNYNATLTDNQNGTYTVKAICTVCGDDVVYAGLSYVNVVVKAPATCLVKGTVEYTFTDADNVTHTISSEIVKGNHILNGVDYKTLLVGGKLPAGVTELTEILGKHYFLCEECGQLVEVALLSDEE